MVRDSNPTNSGGPVNPVVAFTDTSHRTDLNPLNLNDLVVKNPLSTFFMKIEGNSWTELGIDHNDIVVIDRSLKPTKNSTVVAEVEGELVLAHARNLTESTQLWGVITHVVHKR